MQELTFKRFYFVVFVPFFVSFVSSFYGFYIRVHPQQIKIFKAFELKSVNQRNS